MLDNIYKVLLDSMPWPIWVVAPDSTVIFVNKCYEEFYNRRLTEIEGRGYEEILEEDLVEEYYRNLKKCIHSKGIYKSSRYIKGRFLECISFSLKDKEEKVVAIAGIILDSTYRKENEEQIGYQKDILRTIIDALPEVIFYKDRESRFIGYNKSFENFYKERNVKDILGKTDLEIYEDKETAREFMRLDQQVIRDRKTSRFEQTIKGEDGHIRIEENIKIPVIGNDGEVWGVVGLSRDITEKKMLEEKLRHVSEIDRLTGLYNRYSFEEKIAHYDEEEYLPLGILMGDVNGLKLVNDTLGHLEGDKLLKNIAYVLKEACGEKGNVFRWGGDEFIILLPNCDEVMCDEIIERILEGCKKRENQFIQLSISLGQDVKYKLEEDIYNHIRKVEEKVYKQKIFDKKSMKSSILEALRQSLEEKNMETNEHATRVMDNAVAIGKRLGFQRADLDELVLVAQLHDIGKISVPEEILLKTTPLTEDEFEILKTHSEKGYRIINACGELNNVSKCVLTHHEKWDGSGYPLGLKGEEIPLMARIISVVDAYDAMTHDKIYKKAITKEEAILELKRCSGSQFDTYIVEQFIEHLNHLHFSFDTGREKEI